MISDFESIFKEWEKNNKIINKDSNNTIYFSKNKKNMKVEIPSIDLHKLNRNDAITKLNNNIMQCKKNNQKKIKIIHGVGRHSKNNRVLKEIVLKWLKDNNKIIRYYRPGRIGEGSGGVTIAFLK